MKRRVLYRPLTTRPDRERYCLRSGRIWWQKWFSHHKLDLIGGGTDNKWVSAAFWPRCKRSLQYLQGPGLILKQIPPPPWLAHSDHKTNPRSFLFLGRGGGGRSSAQWRWRLRNRHGRLSAALTFACTKRPHSELNLGIGNYFCFTLKSHLSNRSMRTELFARIV